MTSFGKMIPSKNQTNPKYSFAKEKRIKPFTLPKTDFIYTPYSERNDKFSISPKWKFGNAPRNSLTERETYAYYKNTYKKEIDKENINHKWEHSIGGVIGVDRRMKPTIEQTTPGPGRYNPSIRFARYHNGSAGYMGIKGRYDSIMPKTGTNADVGPSTYEIGNRSQIIKFSHSPKFTFGNDKRKGLGKKAITKSETYADYSSLGEQIMAPKDSRPQFSFGKAERFKYGMF